MSIVKITVDNSCVMDSIEKANIRITSPTKKSITLYKARLSQTSKELQDVFWKFCQDPMTRFIGEMDATKEEMELLLQFSKLR